MANNAGEERDYFLMVFRMQPFDLNIENVHGPLAETIAWCSSDRVSKLPATDDIRKHLNRLEEASKLMHEAYKERHRLWIRPQFPRPGG